MIDFADYETMSAVGTRHVFPIYMKGILFFISTRVGARKREVKGIY